VASRSSGEAPDGVRLDLQVQGVVDGPKLKGSFPPLAAYMLVDVDGVGTLYVRAPLVLDDGAALEIEATVRYDFGGDGYAQAAAGNLPDSQVAGCLRFLTGDSRYLWVNRAISLGVGRLYSQDKRIDYDLFVITPESVPATGAALDTSNRSSLYERLGGRGTIDSIVSDFVDGLDTNMRLNRQNPRIAVARAGIDPVERKRNVSDLLCQLAGGPYRYRGPLERAHAPMRLTEADWAIGGDELVKALTRHGIAKVDQGELLTIIETLKPNIVRGA
jgi:hemoglobin